MLLSTYALSTLRVEQKRERASIHALQDCLAQSPEFNDLHRADLASRSEQLIALAELRHQRRLEHGLFPALRAVSMEAGESLRKLEQLGRVGREILPRMRSVLRPGASLGQQQIARACTLVQAYCQNLLERLSCEEDVLLPLAERVLPRDAWFKVGTEFLMQDAERA